MTSSEWEAVKALFEAAIEHPPEARAAFVAASTADSHIRREVQSLLASHRDDAFMPEGGGLQAAAEEIGRPRLDVSAGARLGPYEIVEFIGRGGMGEVYKARDTRLDRLVAIKILGAVPAMDPERRARFQREAHAIAALSHPHICAIHDIGAEDGVDFLVMELLEGETLAERLSRGALATRDAITCAIEIAAALDRAHRDGIVHRDLKPANVMLTSNGAKLLDFGIAKLLTTTAAASTSTSRLTGEGTILGTLNYMSPEQLEGRSVDARADIFAFGAILHEMLSGRRAFDGASQASVIGAILRADPPAVSELHPGTPPALDRVVRRCLAKDADDRWQTARDLLAELRWIGEGLDRAPLRRFASGVRHAATRRVAAAMILVVSAAALVFWRAAPLGSPAGRAVVVLMDSPLPERVYDPETRREGGTNADDLTDALRDLGFELHKETTSGSWHREDQILEQNPTLIVIHVSSFADPLSENPEPHMSRDAQEKLRSFLGYVGLGNPATRFLLYTRRGPDELDQGRWISETEARFPALKGRVQMMHVRGGASATFRDPATRTEITQRVKKIVSNR